MSKEKSVSGKYENDGERVKRDYTFEQYKLFVEMADRVSQRRNVVNVFFLTVQSVALILLVSNSNTWAENQPNFVFVIPVVGFILLCVVWWWILRSYRNLNSAKFKIIGSIEKKLSIDPYNQEWQELGEGKDWKKYLPLSYVEQYVPFLFIALYIWFIVYLLDMPI